MIVPVPSGKNVWESPPPPPPISGLARNKLSGSRISSGTFWPICPPPPKQTPWRRP